MQQVDVNNTTRDFDIELEDESILRVTAVTDEIWRIRRTSDGTFNEPGMVRYGIVRNDWPNVEVTVDDDTANTLILRTSATTLTVDKRSGQLALTRADGQPLIKQAEPNRHTADGFDISFKLSDDERLYGHGDETRDRIQKRGHKGRMVLMNVTSYVPIPFLMSTAGWAVFMNTTWFHYFDAGSTQADRLRLWADHGELDYYLIAGQTLPTLLERYTSLTGRPCLLPRWGYGLTFVCDERGVRARDVLYEAMTFRREGISCDVIGLEPGWMETHYDMSTEKKWSPERFHAPFWKRHNKPGGFSAGLKNMGFKLSLWLACDYDLSEYEEQLLGEASSETALTQSKSNDDDIFKDPHFAPRYADELTKPGEPWFEHLKKFVDDGADAFKLDGACQICFHPDRKWKNGMEDGEMHNLYPLLLGKQMAQGFANHTGRRAMIYTAGGYAGIQQYAATWAGDTGGAEKPLISLLNHGLSGHSNVSCDMQVWSPEGVHFGFLQPWSQILSWHSYNQPWFLPEEMYDVFKFYVALRYRLLPYLYTAAHIAARTGMPMMRAMPLVAPDEPGCDEWTRQYMLGDAFLTCAFDKVLHLPTGRWINFWTDEAQDGPIDVPCDYPAGKGGPLFVKAGSMIPTAPDMSYASHKPLDRLGLEVYPHGESDFVLYEDDGVTHAYLDGKMASTQMKCQSTSDAMTLTINPRSGQYEGMPDQRSFNVAIHHDGRPERVTIDGKEVCESTSEDGWQYDSQARVTRFVVHEDSNRQNPVQVRCDWASA